MGLYLAIFDSDEEIDGLEIGSYADFGRFREVVSSSLEHGVAGSRFPVLMLHSDCDGEWTSAESKNLQAELRTIKGEFLDLPPIFFGPESWQGQVARSFGIEPENLFDSFFDVDGEPLIDRLLDLARLSVKSGRPILFQ